SVASDLYALGVIAYQLFVGQMPYPTKNVSIIITSILNQKPDTSQLSNKDLEAWLQRLLNKEPAQRYPDAYSTMVALCEAMDIPLPPESQQVRESLLQASTFVGREAELKQLTDALRTIETRSAFFLVGGESGVGKSRLLAELRVRALVSGAHVLRGQAVDGGGLPFQVWRNIVRRMLLLVDVTDLQASVLKDIVPDANDLLGRDIPDALNLTGKAYQDRLLHNIVDLFRKLPQSIVLLLEDLQWTSESLAVLQQMLRVSEQLPKLMIIASYRDDEAPDLPQKLTGMTHIKLDRLDTSAVRELSRAMLGELGVRDELVQTIQRNSEGNTFFIIETVRAFAEEHGSLAKITTAELPQVVFTGSMQELMQRRLRRVDDRYSELQRLAAVIGREVDPLLLNPRFDTNIVQAWLTHAADYGVVAVQDNIWRFAHAKLRETILADLTEGEKAALNRTAAETIEAVYPEDSAYNETLMKHWYMAGDFDKELHYLDAVVQQLIEIQGAQEIARTLLQRALARMGADDGRQALLLNWLARSSWSQSDYDASRDYAERARQLATKFDKQAELAISLTNLGFIAEYQGQYAESIDLYQQSLALYQQLGDQHGIARSINNLGRIADKQGDFARATPLLQQGLALYRQLGDQRGISSSLNNLGIIAFIKGEYDDAIDLYQQSLALSQQLGDQTGIAKSLNNLGIIAIDQGEYARASDLFEQSLAIKRKLGDQLGISMTLSNLGMVAENQKAYVRAMDLYNQGLVLSQQIGDQIGVCYGFVYFGGIAFKQKDKKAAHWYAQGLSIAHAMHATSEALWAVAGFVGVLAQDGQTERAAHYAGLAQHHPAQDNNVRKVLGEVLPLLEATLSPEDLQAALERGKELDLETVVQELMLEFGTTDETAPLSS
ncbi:MAG: tetratricopeptide repeat protein, partial [Chloroflexi bacterium]|nr:tetratricopeptide repeat protein [Chloroflexota bacterium]